MTNHSQLLHISIRSWDIHIKSYHYIKNQTFFARNATLSLSLGQWCNTSLQTSWTVSCEHRKWCKDRIFRGNDEMIRPSVCLHVCLSVCSSVCLSVCLSSRLPVCLSVCLCVSVFLSVCLPVCLSVCPSACVCVFLSACLSVFLSACVCVFLSACVCLCVSFCLPVSVCVCLSVCLCVSACPPSSSLLAYLRACGTCAFNAEYFQTFSFSLLKETLGETRWWHRFAYGSHESSRQYRRNHDPSKLLPTCSRNKVSRSVIENIFQWQKSNLVI